ncbi:MAG: GTP cyclohydrolase II [Alyxoria varia]|nr:MAG: GTP cyclohydrolase II [Alyxoria varia]
MPPEPTATVPLTPSLAEPPHSELLMHGHVLRRHDGHTAADTQKVPGALISPTFTPPATPGTGTPALERDAESIPVDTSLTLAPHPNLLPELPTVWCVVRARIPMTFGQEMWLHLYHNDLDDKEHLAIVFGDKIRSRSLDAERPGETEKDRLTRGAYTGRLFPGRETSGSEELRQIHSSNSSTGKASPLLRSIHKPNAPSLGQTLPSTSLKENSLNNAVNSHTSRIESTDSAHMHPHETPVQSTRRPGTCNALPLVRIHSECYTGETVWSARCDCGEQLDEAARLMSLPSCSSSGGVIIYLRQEGRGIGLSEKLKAYNLQDLGSDTVEANLELRHPADKRSYGLATAMLMDLGLGGDGETEELERGIISNDGHMVDHESGLQLDKPVKGIRLLTNNPEKVRAVEGPNREVVVRERVAMVPLAWSSGGKAGVSSPELQNYLTTKIARMGHMFQ